MGTIRKANLISEWRVYEEKTFRYENNPRKAKKLIIGIAHQANGTQEYIMEGVYEDLIPMIANRLLTVHVDLYSEPQIVLEMDGKLVTHNGNVDVLREETLEILAEEKSIVSNQIRSLVELRNNAYSQAVLGKATKMLRLILSDGLGEKLNYDFIRLVLREKYNAVEDANKLAATFAGYTKEELVAAYGEILEKQYTGAVRIEPVRQLIEDKISITDIESALKNEITRRFFEGSIR